MGKDARRKFQMYGHTPIFIALLVLFLSIPAVVGLILKNQATMKNLENRNMTVFPPYRLFKEKPADYIKGVDDYVKDHVGFRQEANEAYRKLRYYVFKDPPLQNITIGKDGHVFLQSFQVTKKDTVYQVLCEDQSAPTPQLTDSVNNILSHASHYYASRGYKTIFALVPSTPVIYPDKLPLNVDKKYRDACLAYGKNDNLLKQLLRRSAAERKYTLFYPYELFYQHKNEPYFFPKERYHWTGKSTYLFTRTLLKDTGVTETLQLNDPSKVAQVKDDLATFFGFNRPIMGYDYPYANRPTKMQDLEWLSQYSKYGTLIHYTTENSLTQKKALLLGNSFTIDFAPHLARAFHEMDYVNLNVIQQNEIEEVFAKLPEHLHPDYIFFVYDDTHTGELPKSLAAFQKLDQ